MAYEDKDAQIAALEARLAALEGRAPQGREPERGEALTVAQVQAMIEAHADKLKINGPGVTGNPKSGFAINPVAITLKAVCMPDGTIQITATS